MTVRTHPAAVGMHLTARTASGLTSVTMRGRSRVRSRRVRLRVFRCTAAGCRARPAYGLARGARRFTAHWSFPAAPAVRVTLTRGRRLIAAWRIRPAVAGGPDTVARPAPAPPPAADPKPEPTPVPTTTPAGPTVLTFETDAPLSPAYAPEIPNYVVTCTAGTPVRVRADLPAGQTLSLDGAPAVGGSLVQDIALTPGQGFRFTVTEDGRPRMHSVRCVPDDFPTWVTERPGEPDTDWIAFSVIVGVGYPYSIIVDDRGVPVWWMRASTGIPADFEVLSDGTVAWARYTVGLSLSQTAYERYELDGTPLGEVSAVGVGADHHEIVRLPNGNFLVVAYLPREHVDLTSIGGPADATVLDNEIQEVTAGGSLVWSWNSSEHIALSETAFPLANTKVTFNGQPMYDLLHVNSAEPMGDGDVLASFRHLNAAFAIRRSDGSIRYKLGGTQRDESLTVLADPLGTATLGGPHDARRLSDGTVTLYDNGWTLNRPPRAVRFRIDETARSATLVEQITDPRAPTSPCCGSARRLPGGHWFVNWGSQPVMTELDAGSNPVLSLRLDNGTAYRALPVSSARVDRTALLDGMDTMHPR